VPYPPLAVAGPWVWALAPRKQWPLPPGDRPGVRFVHFPGPGLPCSSRGPGWRGRRRSSRTPPGRPVEGSGASAMTSTPAFSSSSASWSQPAPNRLTHESTREAGMRLSRSRDEEGVRGRRPPNGGRTSLRWEAWAEPPAGEHSEALELGALGGERGPAGVEEGGWLVGCRARGALPLGRRRSFSAHCSSRSRGGRHVVPGNRLGRAPP
jgi:hypothetical protein